MGVTEETGVWKVHRDTFALQIHGCDELRWWGFFIIQIKVLGLLVHWDMDGKCCKGSSSF